MGDFERPFTAAISSVTTFGITFEVHVISYVCV